MKSKVPSQAIPRLSIYYRTLSELDTSRIVSSEELSTRTGFSAAQVRRDLAYFGQFGTPGRGYQAGDLKERILEILGIDRKWKVALIGVGNLGSALLSYKGFKEQGFRIVNAFDTDYRKIGKVWEGVEIRDISELKSNIKQKRIDMAIVAVPSKAAQQVIDALVNSGIRAIMNFAPMRPKVPSDVELLNIDLSIELERLAHFLKKRSVKKITREL